MNNYPDIYALTRGEEILRWDTKGKLKKLLYSIAPKARKGLYIRPEHHFTPEQFLDKYYPEWREMARRQSLKTVKAA